MVHLAPDAGGGRETAVTAEGQGAGGRPAGAWPRSPGGTREPVPTRVACHMRGLRMQYVCALSASISQSTGLGLVAAQCGPVARAADMWPRATSVFCAPLQLTGTDLPPVCPAGDRRSVGHAHAKCVVCVADECGPDMPTYVLSCTPVSRVLWVHEEPVTWEWHVTGVCGPGVPGVLQARFPMCDVS